jgi:HD-GYP domain-containing protein (c-di-GMP phosphodiesterase class II)
MYVNRTDVQKPKVEAQRQAHDPFNEWEQLRRRLVRLNLAFMGVARAPRVDEPLLAELDQVVERIRVLIAKAPDIAIFEIMQMDPTNYVVAHHLQAAVLAALLAHVLDWPEEAVRNACRVALTMNIAMLELQTVLSAQSQPVSAAQRQVIDDHALQGRRVLETLGVRDAAWLRAVEEHHPERLAPGQAASPLAQLAHHADLYLAKISPRVYRGAKTPSAAARELLQQPAMDKHLVSTLIKLVGIYPPGTYVKLANGETAVVVRRGAGAHAPCVCSLVSGTGMPLGEPVVRDTGLAKYAVAAIVAKERVMVRFERGRLFGLAGQG